MSQYPQAKIFPSTQNVLIPPFCILLRFNVCIIYKVLESRQMGIKIFKLFFKNLFFKNMISRLVQRATQFVIYSKGDKEYPQSFEC